MRVTVVGAGAIGGIVGAHLAARGHDVTFVDADRAHVEAIRRDGLALRGAADLRVFARALLPEEMPELSGPVLLAVKSRHTREAMRAVAPRLGPEGFVVSLQNGLEEYKIASFVGEARTVGAFLTFGGHLAGPGAVVYGGRGSFRLGELDGRITPRVRALAELLSAAHPVEVTDNIFGFLWGKMALGAYYFATALVDADVPEILDRPEYLGTLGRLAAETARVAEALAVRVEPIDGFDPRAFLPELGAPAGQDGAGAAESQGSARLAELRAASWRAQRAYWLRHRADDGFMRTGVWRDLAIHRRPTEVEELVDEVIRRGEALGVATPRLARLVAMVHEAERGERALGWHNLEELRAFDLACLAGRAAPGG